MRRYPRTVVTTAPKRPPQSDEGVNSRASTLWAQTVIALVAWIVLVGVAIVWGEHVVEIGHRLRIHAPPLSGDYRDRSGTVLLLPITIAVLVVAYGPMLSRRLRWNTLLGLAMVIAIGWAIALGLNDGWAGLTSPLLRGQYLRTVPIVGNPLTFVRGFTDHLAQYNIHTQGHPPGMVLILWALAQVGLSGVGSNLALVLIGGAASIAAALVALREVAGEAAARCAAPFLVLAPAAIWWSSGDAFFAGVAAWAVTLVVLATGRPEREGDRLAICGGLLFGIAAMLSYGLVLLAVLPIVVAAARRRRRPLLVAAAAAAIVLLTFLAAGFSWFAGLEATRTQYFAGVASRRPYSYFVLGNLAAFALAVGPAAAIGLAWLRDRRVWLLVGGILLVIAIADLSGMSKAEVERIWLPFVPWLLLATAAFVGSRARSGRVQALLVGQAAVAVVIQAAVRSPW